MMKSIKNEEKLYPLDGPPPSLANATKDLLPIKIFINESINTTKISDIEDHDDDDYDVCDNEDDSFLDRRGGSSNGGGCGSSSTTESSTTTSQKLLSSNITWYLNIVLPVTVLVTLFVVAYFYRDLIKNLLIWIEQQNPWIVFSIFMLLFTIISFPITIGYLVLLISSGYLFGFLRGLLTVIIGANLGIAIVHNVLGAIRTKIPIHRLIKNETGHAILRVISGSRAFKVVLFTRLTPIPFGIQNTIFGVSSINPRTYHTATFLGLLPAQTINVYLGSTLRSMHEVLNNHSTAITGYISLAVEVVFGIGLMFWVIQKARSELSDALLSDMGPDRKMIGITV